MTRLVLGLTLVLVVLAASGWQNVSPSVTAAQAAQLDELMMDLNISPLDAVAPPPLTVTTVEGGGRVRLADIKDRAVLIEEDGKREPHLLRPRGDRRRRLLDAHRQHHEPLILQLPLHLRDGRG